MSTAVIFADAESFFAAVSPRQHDAHCHARRCRANLDRMAEQGDAGCASIEALQAQWREDEARRVAADYSHDTAAIRHALDRWQTGCFSTGHADMRANRIRQLTRALDIAIEWHGMRTAAE